MELKRGSTLFLKVVILLIAIVALAGMIRFPQTEGRAANLDLISIYADPFIIYGYIASIPFFMALYQAFKLLGYVDNNQVFSQSAVKAVRNIKYCAVTISILYVVGMPLLYFIAEADDAPGVIIIGLVIIFASMVIAVFAAVLQKLLKEAIDIKAENDLIV